MRAPISIRSRLLQIPSLPLPPAPTHPVFLPPSRIQTRCLALSPVRCDTNVGLFGACNFHQFDRTRRILILLTNPVCAQCLGFQLNHQALALDPFAAFWTRRPFLRIPDSLPLRPLATGRKESATRPSECCVFAACACPDSGLASTDCDAGQHHARRASPTTIPDLTWTSTEIPNPIIANRSISLG